MMQTRLGALRRLANLYAAVEELHSTEFQRMTAAVRETQNAIDAEQEIARSALNDGRGALLEGDRVSWIVAKTQQQAAAHRRQDLDQIRLGREELNEVAREQYVASRLKREQMKRVFDDIAAGMEIEERRRLQAASDDRFVARRRWTDDQKRLRDKRQINAS
jgi:hypothetical protein